MTPLNRELSFEVPDWIYLLFFSAVNQNLRSLENYQSWISELLFGTWSYGPGLQSVFDRVLHTDRYNMEIMSWKERAKDVYLQVAMHPKNELVSAANEWFFWYIATNDLKSFQHFWWYDVFISNIPIFFTFEFEDWKRTTVKIHRSSNQRHEW